MKSQVQALRPDQPARPVQLAAGEHRVCGCGHAQGADGLCRGEVGCKSQALPYCDQSHQR